MKKILLTLFVQRCIFGQRYNERACYENERKDNTERACHEKWTESKYTPLYKKHTKQKQIGQWRQLNTQRFRVVTSPQLNDNSNEDYPWNKINYVSRLSTFTL